ncbi:hypothetical protein L1D34_21845, partial [Vibrio mediterranei]|uniref:hypothetical protein n=1 Tax=Vibrio mediterranei TaxID=689 RepID=UPI001EFE32E8
MMRSVLFLFSIFLSINTVAAEVSDRVLELSCGSYLKKDDLLSRYYSDMRDGHAVDMRKNVFTLNALIDGTDLTNARVTPSVEQFTNKFVKNLHQAGFIEKETCRLSESKFPNNIAVVTSRYMNFFQDKPNDITYGVKVVVINTKLRKIIMMNWRDQG